MPSLKIAVAHQLGTEEARARLTRLLEMLRESYGSQASDVNEAWRDGGMDFAFKAMGFKTSGSVEVRDDSVQIDAQLPLAAMMFKGKIEQQIRGTLERILR